MTQSNPSSGEETDLPPDVIRSYFLLFFLFFVLEISFTIQPIIFSNGTQTINFFFFFCQIEPFVHHELKLIA